MAIISIAGGSADESSSNYLRFEVTLSSAQLDAVTVNYRTLLGTAYDNDLYNHSTNVNNNGTVTFAAGETSKEIAIRLGGDTNDEFDENIFVELFNPAGAEFASGAPVARAMGIILDNDGPGSNLALFVSNPVLIEGNAGTKNATFEIKLSRPAASALSVDYRTVDGTARAGEDYVATSGTVNFAAGQQTAIVNVPVIGDLIPERAEIFSLVATPSLASIAVTGAVGEALILDTDTSALPEISIAGGSALESSSHYVRFVVTLSQPSLDAVTVAYRTLLKGTALDNDLYDPTTGASNNGTVTFAAGETSKNILIRIQGDSIDERDEDFTIELYNPVGAVFAAGDPVARATGIILDDDGPGSNLALAVSSPVVVEGESGTKEAVFEIIVSRPASQAFTIVYRTADGSAVAGEDYEARQGTIDFAPGQRMAAVHVPIMGDTIPEAAEFFSLVVAPQAGSPVVAPGAAGITTILNRSDQPEISIAGGRADESSSHYVRFVVTLSQPSLDAVTVTYRTLINGTASDDDLYNPSTNVNNNGVVTFAAGETSKNIFIRIQGDSIDERDENFTVELYDPVGAVFAGGEKVARATGIILDNDGPGSNLALFVSSPVVVEGDAGTKHAVFEIVLSQPVNQEFTVSYRTADGTAVAGEDYEAVSGEITFLPGQTVAAVKVPVIGDTVSEAAEFFSLIVTPPASPVIAAAGAVGVATILDDDTSPLPSISVAGGRAFESSSHYIRFVVTLSEQSGQTVEVNYATVLGTASDGDLYNPSSNSANRGTLVFAPGETTKSVFIRLQGDAASELDETIFLRLTDPKNAVFGGNAATLHATGFILDNDNVGQTLMLSGTPTQIRQRAEEAVRHQIAVELSRPVESELTFNVAAIAGTALDGVHFRLLDDTVTFAPGQTKAGVGVEILGNSEDIPQVSFDLSFQSVGGQPFPAAAVIPLTTVTILDGPAWFDTTDGPDVINGTAKNDVIDGKGGDDQLFGGEGADILFGGPGDDLLDGQGNLEIRDGSGNVIGGQGNVLVPGAGNNTIIVRSALDIVDNGILFPDHPGRPAAVNEIISYSDFWWDLYGAGSKLVLTEETAETHELSAMIGWLFDSEISGNSGDNIIFTVGGNNVVRPGGGIDWLAFGVTDGFRGTDTLVIDKVAPGASPSWSIAWDFMPGEDKVDLTDLGLGSFAAVQAQGQDDGAGNSFYLFEGGTNILFLVGVEKADMAAADFFV